MAVAFIQEWKNAPPGTENYDAITSRLDAANDPPDGLIAHTAGHDGNGVWRIFDIWETREQAERFQQERLMPIVREMMEQRGPEEMPQPDVMDMYEIHDLIRP